MSEERDRDRVDSKENFWWYSHRFARSLRAANVARLNRLSLDYGAAWDLLDGIMARLGYANPWGPGSLELKAIIDEAWGGNHDSDHVWRYQKHHDRCLGCALTRLNVANGLGTPGE